MTQLVDLDFIETPLFEPSKTGLLRLALLILGVIAVILTWLNYQTKQEALVALEAETMQLKIQKKHQPITKALKVNVSPEQIKSINAVNEVLMINWDGLFKAIETSHNKNITLLSFEPSIKKKQVLLIGNAKKLQDVLQYIEQLKLQPQLNTVFLQKHSVENSTNAVNIIAMPVLFTIQAGWKTEP